MHVLVWVRNGDKAPFTELPHTCSPTPWDTWHGSHYYLYVSGEETEAGEIDCWAAGWNQSWWPVAESVSVSSEERALTLPWSPYRMILPQCCGFSALGRKKQLTSRKPARCQVWLGAEASRGMEISQHHLLLLLCLLITSTMDPALVRFRALR